MTDENTSPEQRVADTLEHFRLASIQGDADAMGEALAEDCVSVTPFGSKVTKVELLDFFRTGAISTELVDVEDLQIRILGEAAIAQGLYHVVNTAGGRRMDSRIRRLDVLVLAKGAWRLLTSQATQVSDPG